MSIKTLTGKVSITGQHQIRFIIHFLSYGLNHNYINIARYGHLREDTYRKNCGRYFDFLEVNIQLVKDSLSDDCVRTFDPFLIPKVVNIRLVQVTFGLAVQVKKPLIWNFRELVLLICKIKVHCTYRQIKR